MVRVKFALAELKAVGENCSPMSSASVSTEFALILSRSQPSVSDLGLQMKLSTLGYGGRAEPEVDACAEIEEATVFVFLVVLGLIDAVAEIIDSVTEPVVEVSTAAMFPVVLEAIDTVTELMKLFTEPVEDGLLLLAPVPKASPITPHADGLSQLDAISSTDEIAARSLLIEGSTAMLANVTWLRVQPEAQLDTDEDADLLEDIDEVLMAVLEAVCAFELDGFALVTVAL